MIGLQGAGGFGKWTERKCQCLRWQQREDFLSIFLSVSISIHLSALPFFQWCWTELASSSFKKHSVWKEHRLCLQSHKHASHSRSPHRWLLFTSLVNGDKSSCLMREMFSSIPQGLWMGKGESWATSQGHTKAQPRALPHLRAPPWHVLTRWVRRG